MMLPPAREEEYGTEHLGRIGGFSLHAGVAVNTRERKKLERICPGGPAGISRPALSEARLELTDQGMVRYALKTAYRDGTTHAVFFRRHWRLINESILRALVQSDFIELRRQCLTICLARSVNQQLTNNKPTTD
ncbi:MAG: hypothetical protein ACI9US_003486 [Gammaproteobacteria bacterium]|jgi:hypothetical protein